MVDWEKYGERRRLLGRSRLILPHHQEVVSDFIRFFSKQPLESEIADIGCSTGFFLGLLRELGFQNITGFDIAQYNVEQARLKGLNCHVANVLNRADFDDETATKRYDFVILMDIIEHLDKPADAIALVLEKMLKADGTLYITTPIYDSIIEKYRRKRYKLTKREQSQEHDPTHLQAFSQDSIHEMMRRTGLEVTESLRLYCQIPRISNPRWLGIISLLLPEKLKGKFLRVTATPV